MQDFQVIGRYTTDSQHIKRRFIYAAGIDEPICMVVEPDHQGWYGLDEFSTIASSWLCETQDPCYDEDADYNIDDIINIYDLTKFISEYYLTDRPLPTNTQYYGYVFDGRGNVVALTYRNDPNQTGNPNEDPYFVETYSYDPFGAPTIYDCTGQPLAQSAIGNPYMFTAREYDTESGLYYYRLRMYSPTIGRFMQTDPIGYYDSMNLYQYCLNNPINWIDPQGLATIKRRPLSGTIVRFLAGKLYGRDNSGGQHWQIFYDDGTNSGYFKGEISFQSDSAINMYDQYIDFIDGLNDKYMKKAEQNIQKRWIEENRTYSHPHNDCQSYVNQVLNEYYRLIKGLKDNE